MIRASDMRAIGLTAIGLIAVSLVVVGLAIGSSGEAVAHGKVSRTEPADGATIRALPAAITVRFDGPHRVTLLRLIDAAGIAIPLKTDRSLKPVPEISTPAPELAPGVYTLEWRALAADGHAMKGASSFTYAPDE